MHAAALGEPHIAVDNRFRVHQLTDVGSGERPSQSTELPVGDVQNCV